MAAKTEQKMIHQLSQLTFGIEIETVNMSRRAAAHVIASTIQGTYQYEGGYYDKHVAVAIDGRKWVAMSDASIGYSNAEIVSPILGYSDIPQLQEIVRALRRAGARVDHRCGIHIHIGAAPFNSKAIQRLASYWNRQEEILQRMFNCSTNRFSTWARPVSPRFLQEIENRPPQSRSDISRAWYGADGTAQQRQHYNDTRYHALNLHNIFFRGTIEFRCFDSTLHAGKIRAYVQFCLAIANKALRGRWSQRSQAARRSYDPATAKYDARTILLRLNLSGDEFATCRLHLTRHFAGGSNTAGTNGRRDRREHQARQAAAAQQPRDACPQQILATRYRLVNLDDDTTN